MQTAFVNCIVGLGDIILNLDTRRGHLLQEDPLDG